MRTSTNPNRMVGEISKGNIMFYALRTQQITDTITERQLLQFYTKKARASYLEMHSDDAIIKAKEAYKFSFRAPGYPVRCPEAGIIFFVHTVY